MTPLKLKRASMVPRRTFNTVTVGKGGKNGYFRNCSLKGS